MSPLTDIHHFRVSIQELQHFLIILVAAEVLSSSVCSWCYRIKVGRQMTL